MPSLKAVAKYGYTAIIKGGAVAINGFLNRLMVASLRISPRSLVVNVVKWVQRK